MKSLFFASILSVLISFTCTAQWLSSGNNIYNSNTGNVGIGTTSPTSYFHGGNNKVLEIHNFNADMHSQSHIILSSNSIFNTTSVGTVSWVSPASTVFQPVAYIGVSLDGDATTNAAGKMVFAVSDGSAITQKLFLDKSGNVGIGISAPAEKLAVNGKIRAQEIKVETANWPDYVFNADYKIPTLKEVKTFISQNHHLKDLPSAAEVNIDGLSLGEINKQLTKKIEELTLYLIEKDDQLQKQEVILNTQQSQIEGILKTLREIKK